MFDPNIVEKISKDQYLGDQLQNSNINQIKLRALPGQNQEEAMRDLLHRNKEV